MSAIQPTSRPQTTGAVWAWFGVGAAAVAAFGISVLWAAGHLSTKLATGDWARQGWNLEVVTGLPDGGIESVWPKANVIVFWVIVAVVAIPVVLAAMWGIGRWLSRPQSDSLHRGLATTNHLQALTEQQQKRSATRLRESLRNTKPRDVERSDAGVILGRLDKGSTANGPLLMAGWEDSAIAIMAPRSGKTTSLVVPAILDAPGAVVATSNKADILITADLRRRRTGQTVWLFDPQSITHGQQEFWWNPLDGIDSVESAERLAGHFVSTVEDQNRKDIWGPAATALLAGLILAAAIDGRPMAQVYEWLSSGQLLDAVSITEDNGFAAVSTSLQAHHTGEGDTKSSVDFTAQAAARCMRNPAIMSWLEPTTDLPEFKPAAFVNSTETLYLLSKDSGGSAAPLVAALVDATMRAGIVTGERAGGRLDPPLSIIGDEICSCAPISDLPLLMSHTGSRSILVLAVMQSWPQGEKAFGQQGMASLWGACTIKLVGPGQEDSRFNELIAKLTGDQWVTTSSYSVGGHRGGSQVSTSVTKQAVMSAAAVRGIPKGKALLIAAGAEKPALIKLQPWYDGKHRSELQAAETKLAKTIGQDAQ